MSLYREGVHTWRLSGPIILGELTQMALGIIDSAMEKLGLPPEKAFVNISKYGNTSAASIPIALDEAKRAGAIEKGDTVIFVAFGAGLTWANAVVKF